MTTGKILEILISQAKTNPTTRQSLITAVASNCPATEIARVSTEIGYPVTAMDIVSIGEEMYGNMKRSTNGGGENSPVLEGEDDFFEIFLSELEEIE